MVLQAVLSTCQNYYNQIPADTLPKVAKSAFYTFSATLIVTGLTPGKSTNLARPLAAAGIASLASLIYGLTAPIFNMAFGDNHIVWYREVLKQNTTMSIASILFSYATTSKVNLFAIHFLTGLSLNLLKSIPELLPSMMEWVLGSASSEAKAVRDCYQWLGIDAQPGTSSVFLDFGLGIGF